MDIFCHSFSYFEDSFHIIHTVHNHLQAQYFQGFSANLLFHFFVPYAIICLALKTTEMSEWEMSKLKIYKNNYADTTVIPNRFIDEYMVDANDAQIKVYLYLVRMMSANLSTSVSDMADIFNHTEKDVMRSLKYWEKQHLISLEYDENKNLTGIHMTDFANAESSTDSPALSSAPICDTVVAKSVAEAVVKPSSTVTMIPKITPEKPVYSLDDLKAFKEQENTAQLLFIAEAYLQKTLSPSEIQTILFFSDGLKMSDDLIDYLIQYCVDRGKKDFKYIEKVAITWAEQGIKTPAQAKKISHKYTKIVYAVMNALGKSSNPTDTEVSYIQIWTKDWGFTDEIIFEACKRTVAATDKHRFEYADKILASWKAAQVISLTDIDKLDELYKKRKTAATSSKASSKNSFCQFEQRDYDFDALEKELLSN